MRRRALATSASVAAVALVLLSSSPAAAATLPVTDELHALTGSTVYTTTSTGASTYLADLPQPDDGKFGADFDVTTGLAYFFANDGDPACTVYSMVPATGVSTLVGPVVADGMDECDSLNVDRNGTLRVGDQDGVIATVNKTTGATISSITVGAPAAGLVSFIEQSSTGQFYVGTYDGGIYTLNVSTGAVVLVAEPTGYIETASFDSADTLWISGAGSGCQGLSSLSLTDPVGTFTAEGDFLDTESSCLNAYAMFISQPVQPVVPVEPEEPELAATGPVDVDAMFPIALLVLIAGAGALALSRPTRTITA